MRMRATRMSAVRHAGGRRLSATARAIQALRASGRNGLLSPLPTEQGFAFKDRGLTQPLVYPCDLEQQALAVIPANAVPPGVRPWSLGANLWDDTAATVSGESQILGGGRYRIYSSAGTNSFVRLNGVIQANKAYLVTFFVESVAVAGAGLRFMDAGTNVPASTGWKTAFLSASSNNPFTHAFIKRDAGATDIVIRNITLQEVVYNFDWLGANLFTGGDFEAGTGSAFPIRCTAAQSTAQVLAGSYSLLCTVNDSSASARVERALLTINKTYLVEAWVYLPSGQSITGLRIAQAGVGTSVFGEAAQTSVTNTWVKLRAVVGAFVTTIGVSATSAGSVGNIWYVDDITVQEIQVGLMIAPTAGGKRMSARVNLLQRTEDFAHSAWVKGASVAITQNAAAAPDGTFTADLFDATGTSNTNIYQTFTTAAGASHKCVWRVKPVSSGWLRFVFSDGAGTNQARVWLDMSTGALGSVNAIGSCTVSGASVTALANGWLRVEFTASQPAASAFNFVSAVAGNNSGTFATGSAYLWGADCRLSIYTGSAYPAYQRVNDGTAGVFDYDHAGFPVMTQIPAAGAGLHSVGLLGLTATDAVRMGAVAVKLSDAATAIIAETSTSLSTNNGAVYLVAPSSNGQSTVQNASKGTAAVNRTYNGIVAPVVFAANSYTSISLPTVALAINGVWIENTSSQGAGNYGAHPYFDGGRNLTGSPSLPATNVRQVGWFADIADAEAVDPTTWADMLRERAAVVGLTY